ncbi:MAG: tetratricopeptide repeat protein [Planctomycetota bacterium]
MRAVWLLTILAGVAMADELPRFDELWDYHKPDETEKRFRALLPQAEASGSRDYHLQLLTQIARTLGLQAKFDEAHKVLDEVEPRLTEETKTARMRYLLERGRIFNSSKHPDKARPLFVRAWEYGLETKRDFHAVDAAHMLALVEPPGKKLAWNLKAMELAEKSQDKRAKRWLGALYNNVGWDFHDQKKYQEALEAHEKCREWYQAHAPKSRGALIAKWSVAKQLRYLDQFDRALELQRALLDDWKEVGEQDGFVYEELAECLLAQGKEADATPYFKQAYALLEKIPWVKDDYPERWARLKRLAGAQ